MEMNVLTKNLAAIAALNFVEGYNPEADSVNLVRATADATDPSDVETVKYLPLRKKLAWALMKNPNGYFTKPEIIYPAIANMNACIGYISNSGDPGKINPLIQAADTVVVQVSYYRDKDCYASTGIGSAEIGSAGFGGALKMAIGQAKSDALTTAGFGLQFYGNGETTMLDELSDNNNRMVVKEMAEKLKESVPVIAPVSPTTINVSDQESKNNAPLDGTMSVSDTTTTSEKKSSRRTNLQRVKDSVEEYADIKHKMKTAMAEKNDILLRSYEKDFNDLMDTLTKAKNKIPDRDKDEFRSFMEENPDLPGDGYTFKELLYQLLKEGTSETDNNGATSTSEIEPMPLEETKEPDTKEKVLSEINISQSENMAKPKDIIPESMDRQITEESVPAQSSEENNMQVETIVPEVVDLPVPEEIVTPLSAGVITQEINDIQPYQAETVVPEIPDFQTPSDISISTNIPFDIEDASGKQMDFADFDTKTNTEMHKYDDIVSTVAGYTGDNIKSICTKKFVEYTQEPLYLLENTTSEKERQALIFWIKQDGKLVEKAKSVAERCGFEF